jgi:hypothetical protein
VRLTADLPTADSDTLIRVARSTGFNKVTTLIRAIRLLALVEDERADGATIRIHRPDGGVRDIVPV